MKYSLLLGLLRSLLVLSLCILTACTSKSPVGTTRTLHGSQDEGRIFLFVQEGAHYQRQTALQERDDKTLLWIFGTYEHFDVPNGTQARILQWDAANAQVEITDGPLAGRRGWVSTRYL